MDLDQRKVAVLAAVERRASARSDAAPEMLRTRLKLIEAWLRKEPRSLDEIVCRVVENSISNSSLVSGFHGGSLNGEIHWVLWKADAVFRVMHCATTQAAYVRVLAAMGLVTPGDFEDHNVDELTAHLPDELDPVRYYPLW